MLCSHELQRGRPALTPALSPGEREKCSAGFNEANMLSHPTVQSTNKREAGTAGEIRELQRIAAVASLSRGRGPG